MTDLILEAAQLARRAHEGQRRQYTSRPYIEHPARVAGMTAILPGATEIMVAAAFLHDVLEDTKVTAQEMSAEIGDSVTQIVIWLTKPTLGSKEPRAVRVQKDHEFLAKAPREAQEIKMLDRIDNLREMDGGPENFIRLYTKESWLLLSVIGHCNTELAITLKDAIIARENSLSAARCDH